MSQSSPSSQPVRPKIIAAIPCFNTERFIGSVVSRAREYAEQVIVIDDGSHDGTAEAAKAAGALVVNHRVNTGYGESIKSCFKVAKANDAGVLVILDGDGQHNPDEIPRILSPILNGEADIVIGSRFLTKESNMPRYRKFGIGVITSLYNLGSKAKVSDSQSGFRAYSKRALDSLSLTEKGMGISVEILVEATAKKLVIKELPISCVYTQSSLTIGAIRHGLGVATNVIKLRLRSRWRRLTQNKEKKA